MPLVRLPDCGGKTIELTQYGPHNYFGPPDCPDHQLENVHNIEIHDDDVMLVSYPKSGCHWLWEMARMLREGTTEVVTVEKENYMMELKPHDSFLQLPPRRIFNTHLYFEQLPQKVQDGKIKLLFIYRNPKDVAVSFYNHHSKFPEYDYKGEFRDYLKGLFLTGNVDSGNIFTYTRKWEEVMDTRPDLPIFVLSYEELQTDAFSKMKELAQFLGSSASEDTLRDIVEKCSFNSMADRKGKEWTDAYGAPIMYRKGKVGDWKNWFTVADNEMMDQIIDKEMKGSRFKFQYTF